MTLRYSSFSNFWLPFLCSSSNFSFYLSGEIIVARCSADDNEPRKNIKTVPLTDNDVSPSRFCEHGLQSGRFQPLHIVSEWVDPGAATKHPTAAVFFAFGSYVWPVLSALVRKWLRSGMFYDSFRFYYWFQYLITELVGFYKNRQDRESSPQNKRVWSLLRFRWEFDSAPFAVTNLSKVVLHTRYSVWKWKAKLLQSGLLSGRGIMRTNHIKIRPPAFQRDRRTRRTALLEDHEGSRPLGIRPKPWLRRTVFFKGAGRTSTFRDSTQPMGRAGGLIGWLRRVLIPRNRHRPQLRWFF